MDVRHKGRGPKVSRVEERTTGVLQLTTMGKAR